MNRKRPGVNRKKDKKERVFCICSNATETNKGFMICCDKEGCNTWFHGRCVGISRDDVDKGRAQNWHCLRCDKRKLLPPRELISDDLSMDFMYSPNVEAVEKFLEVREFEQFCESRKYIETPEQAQDPDAHPEIVKSEILKKHMFNFSERDRRKVEKRRIEGLELSVHSFEDWREDLGITVDENLMQNFQDVETKDRYLLKLLETKKQMIKKRLLKLECEKRRFAWRNSMAAIQGLSNRWEEEFEMPKPVIKRKTFEDLNRITSSYAVKKVRESQAHGSIHSVTRVNPFSWSNRIPCFQCRGDIPSEKYSEHTINCKQKPFEVRKVSLTSGRTTAFGIEKQKCEDSFCGFCPKSDLKQLNEIRICEVRTSKKRKIFCEEHGDWKGRERKRIKLETRVEERILKQMEAHISYINDRLDYPKFPSDLRPISKEESWLELKEQILKIPNSNTVQRSLHDILQLPHKIFLGEAEQTELLLGSGSKPITHFRQTCSQV